MLHAYIDGHLGGELEVEFVDQFLAAMARRGFSVRKALEIFRALGLVAMGAATATAHMRAHQLVHGGFARSVATALDAREEGELPSLWAARAEYVDIAGKPDLAPLVALLINGFSGPD